MNRDKDPPGSWPQESDQEPQTIDTCIHPGRGLPESSSLVIRGKEELDERNDVISKAIETAKKSFHTTRRSSGQGRRPSMESPTSGLPSLSEQWKREGVMRSLEN